MSDNDKIANWVLNGRFPKDLSEAERRAYGIFTYRNNRLVDNLDAVVLLPVLVEKGYWWQLHFNPFVQDHTCTVYFKTGAPSGKAYGKTIAEAITAAILQLLESEAKNESLP